MCGQLSWKVYLPALFIQLHGSAATYTHTLSLPLSLSTWLGDFRVFPYFMKLVLSPNWGARLIICFLMVPTDCGTYTWPSLGILHREERRAHLTHICLTLLGAALSSCHIQFTIITFHIIIINWLQPGLSSGGQFSQWPRPGLGWICICCSSGHSTSKLVIAA